MRLCPLGLFRSHFATLHDQRPLICHRHHHSMLLLAVLQQWSLYSSFGLIWHISFFLSSLKVSKVRFIYEELKSCVVEVFAEVRVVKAVPSCGGDHFLHRQCSRVARFDDIFYFGFWCNSSLFFSSVMHRVNSPNATTLHSRCIWEGVLRYNSQGFFPLVSPMYSIYSPYWASIVRSSSVSLYS
jgi:hypothetical protein